MNLPTTGLLAVALLSFAFTSSAHAQGWQDSFESYVAGSGLEGQGSWENQNGVTTQLTVVSADQAATGTHSAQVLTGASTVRPMPTATSGVWELTTYVYVPSSTSAQLHVRALSAYQQSGPMQVASWFLIDGAAGNVLCFAGQPAPFVLPLPRDRWVEISSYIDLDADTAGIFFDGTQVTTMAWTGGSNGQQGNPVAQLEALQLIGAGGPGGIWVDDVRMLPASSCLCSYYCSPAVPNSTGLPATIRAHGSAAVADNQVTLVAADLPLQSFAFVIASQTQAFVAGPGGSAGDLCVGGSIGRFVGPGQVQNSGTMGGFSLAIDLTQIPQPVSFVAVQPGETWNFQAWYRDAVGGVATSNFTDGISVNFH